MSRGDRFFTPQSLVRVANAIEWEDELVQYKDGTTNQSCFMQAIGILYERWMREWILPDVERAFMSVAAGEFSEAFKVALDTQVERVSQLAGWFRGLWEGANPGWWSSQRQARSAIVAGETNPESLLALLYRWSQMLTAIVDTMRL